ncbi:MarR family transcriptional regulator [Pseudorhodobacter sp. E13]|uniref:MarR family winged helix-turn-helix transcriptional regulator n=1 Tax=Pseudorhodobacter sp. E13 TaxID=2487931 RepID=UPI000F8F01EE|nr:MarR family transcriptional regulator [Pseudorhodobacter sp. E13]RUS65227.1 MarR family transcriptional regulator [Pseudorhodobacter sp. E13]
MNYEQFPQYWVNHLGFQLRKELEEAFAAKGQKVTSEEWALLLILNKHEQLSPRILAKLTLRDSTTVSRLVDRLERKGLVERIRERKDRRVVDVVMTAAGRAEFSSLSETAKAFIDTSLRGIAPEDAERVIQILKRMSENLSAAKRTQDV